MTKTPDELIIELRKLYGSAKGKKIHVATKKELDALARKLYG